MTKIEKSFRYLPEDLAEHFRISLRQVVEIAEAGNLISEDGSIDLISYIAFLNGEEPHVK